MLYIRQTACISPQEKIFDNDPEVLNHAVDGKLIAKEPTYEGIPPGILRRMGKAVRIGVGTALQLIKKDELQDGIIIGTANGGMEDCMKFLEQIIEYDEGVLSPGNFVQGVPNAIAAQIGLLSRNKAYNITHVHRGLAFENSLIDAIMQLKEQPKSSYLVGAVDEISSFNYNIELLKGNFKTSSVAPKDFYNPGLKGAIAGEGSAMFLVDNNKENSIARLTGIDTIHTSDTEIVKNKINYFINKYLPESETIDLFLSGENGDEQTLKYYTAIESVINKNIPTARFKHLCGEYSTASAYALWLSCQLFQSQSIPTHLMKSNSVPQKLNRILFYNNYAGTQHSFMLIEKVN
jgi:hypothetical protein